MGVNFEGLLIIAVIIVGDICIISLAKLLKLVFGKPQRRLIAGFPKTVTTKKD